jgi:mannose/fructose/N-acetylgalactosamine-specific phosphotransferase system component IIC
MNEPPIEIGLACFVYNYTNFCKKTQHFFTKDRPILILLAWGALLGDGGMGLKVGGEVGLGVMVIVRG